MSGNNHILNLIPDKGIYWTGGEIPEIGITESMLYSEAMAALLKNYISLLNAKFDIWPIYSDPVSRDEAINKAIGKINQLNTGDISHNGIPFNNNRLSIEAGKFIGTKFEYSIETNSNGSQLNLNIKDSLPLDTLSTRIVVSGKSVNGKNVFMDTPEKITSVVLKNEMYPIDIDVQVRTQTRTGIVDLQKKIVLHNPSESGLFKPVYDVYDRSYNAPFSGKLTDWLGGIEATQNRLELYHDLLKNMPGGDILNIVSGHSFAINELDSKIKQAGTVNISLPNPDGTITTKTTTPQDAINSLSMAVTNLLKENTTLNNELKAIQQKVNNVSSNPSGGGLVGTINEQNASLSTSVVQS